MDYIQARRLAGMMTSRQRRELQLLAQACREIPDKLCDRYDPITASCAQSCCVCSHMGHDCLGQGLSALPNQNPAMEFRVR